MAAVRASRDAPPSTSVMRQTLLEALLSVQLLRAHVQQGIQDLQTTKGGASAANEGEATPGRRRGGTEDSPSGPSSPHHSQQHPHNHSAAAGTYTGSQSQQQQNNFSNVLFQNALFHDSVWPEGQGEASDQEEGTERPPFDTSPTLSHSYSPALRHSYSPILPHASPNIRPSTSKALFNNNSPQTHTAAASPNLPPVSTTLNTSLQNSHTAASTLPHNSPHTQHNSQHSNPDSSHTAASPATTPPRPPTRVRMASLSATPEHIKEDSHSRTRGDSAAPDTHAHTPVRSSAPAVSDDVRGQSHSTPVRETGVSEGRRATKSEDVGGDPHTPEAAIKSKEGGRGHHSTPLRTALDKLNRRGESGYGFESPPQAERDFQRSERTVTRSLNADLFFAATRPADPGLHHTLPHNIKKHSNGTARKSATWRP